MRLLQFLCALLATLSLGTSSPIKPGPWYKDQQWDHFVFMQQYPAGVCESKHCNYPANISSWTIHGLWPTFEETRGPNFCNESASFSINEIKDLIPKMTEAWPDLFNGTEYGSFWMHEWTKHGTCSGMDSEHTYFKTALDIHSQQEMQLGHILSQQGIVPSEKPYDVQDFITAIQQELGVEQLYEINCEKSILNQIGICLDQTTYKPISCPAAASISSCGSDGGTLYYPTSKYHQ